MRAGKPTPDLQKQIADMFYDGALFERAIKEYEGVLAANPGRRDVIERIAEYYIGIGDEALKVNKLEESQMAFQKAIDADQLDSDAQRKLIEVNKLIREREERRAVAEAAVAQGQQITRDAERMIFAKSHSQAMARLLQARELFQTAIPEGGEFEFPNIVRRAQNGLRITDSRLSEVRGLIINNSPDLSGSGSTDGAKRQARAAASQLTQSAMQALVRSQLEDALKDLKDQNQNLLP